MPGTRDEKAPHPRWLSCFSDASIGKEEGLGIGAGDGVVAGASGS
ncbi:MAG: hypothetical protein VX505_01215 [Chloroflexota bacterium]|nr:hypothetical protein [Chloroflexota bacterium]